MQMMPWARRHLTRERMAFVVSVLSLFAVLGLLMFWVHLALQHP